MIKEYTIFYIKMYMSAVDILKYYLLHNIAEDIDRYISLGNTKFSRKWKNFEHQKHRQSNPAVIKYFENGSIKEKVWFYNGKYHRCKVPAFFKYFENGNIENEEWYKNNECHRIDGPATTHYYDNGFSVLMIWRYRNKKHNINDNPAQIRYITYSNTLILDWYHCGQFYNVNNIFCRLIYKNNKIDRTCYDPGPRDCFFEKGHRPRIAK